MKNWIPTAAPNGPRLALRPREAAAALGIGLRLLWQMTRDGRIPHLKIGRITLYPVQPLERWLAQQSRQTTQPTADSPSGPGNPGVDDIDVPADPPEIPANADESELTPAPTDRPVSATRQPPRTCR